MFLTCSVQYFTILCGNISFVEMVLFSGATGTVVAQWWLIEFHLHPLAGALSGALAGAPVTTSQVSGVPQGAQ